MSAEALAYLKELLEGMGIPYEFMHVGPKLGTLGRVEGR